MVAPIPLKYLDPNEHAEPFPDVEQALHEPNGLLAFGGDLSPPRLLRAYRHGIFPWYSDGQPILWWSPDPRAVLFPDQLKISRSLRRSMRKNIYTVTMDKAFRAVIEACAQPRVNSSGTWITGEMIDAYCHLHDLGHAHSIEAWHASKLVGGLYGIAMGKVFFGESMFTRQIDASKVAFVHLVQHLLEWGYKLIDCQVASVHLASLGAKDLPRKRFIELLDCYCDLPTVWGPWNSNHE